MSPAWSLKAPRATHSRPVQRQPRLDLLWLESREPFSQADDGRDHIKRHRARLHDDGKPERGGIAARSAVADCDETRLNEAGSNSAGQSTNRDPQVDARIDPHIAPHIAPRDGFAEQQRQRAEPERFAGVR